MEDVSKGGRRTILFVSHNMAMIQNLCNKTMLLNMGELEEYGDTNLVVQNYLKNMTSLKDINLTDRKDRLGDGKIHFTDVQMCDENNEIIQLFMSGQNVILEFYYINRMKQPLKNLRFGIGIDNMNGIRIAFMSNELINQTFDFVSEKNNKIRIHIPELPLSPGRYVYTIFSEIDGVISDWIQGAGIFEVEPGDFYNTGKLIPPGQGNFLLKYHFELNQS